MSEGNGKDSMTGRFVAGNRYGGKSPGSPVAKRMGELRRAILDATNECLGHFDDRPPGERWCDALLHLLDLATFAADLGATAPDA